MKKRDMEHFAPVIVWANNYQFAKDDKIVQPCVESRMLLWCKVGCGEVIVNSQRFIMNPEDFLLLPWRRHIEYRPNSKMPFLVGGIHFIPRHAENHQVEFEVAHNRSHRLFGKLWRADALPDELPSFFAGSLKWNKQLKYLAEYIVADFEEIKCNARLAKNLGNLLCTKLIKMEIAVGNETVMPLNLRQMLEYVCGHVSEKISINNLADIGQCSESTVIRLFLRYFKVTPVQWLLQFRINQAASLLSSTRLPVGEIGRRVGIDDPYYFSKLFKKINGKTAREYRSKNASF